MAMYIWQLVVAAQFKYKLQHSSNVSCRAVQSDQAFDNINDNINEYLLIWQDFRRNN
jgi:hypothetical protein